VSKGIAGALFSTVCGRKRSSITSRSRCFLLGVAELLRLRERYPGFSFVSGFLQRRAQIGLQGRIVWRELNGECECGARFGIAVKSEKCGSQVGLSLNIVWFGLQCLLEFCHGQGGTLFEIERAHDRILKMAPTIADLDAAPDNFPSI
jgi:hypothetical protein